MEISEAENGDSALALVKDVTYDLIIIMDVQIPDTDRFILLECVKTA